MPLIHLKNQNNGSKINAEGRNNKIEIEKVLLSCNPGTNLKIISSNIWSDLDLKRGRKKSAKLHWVKIIRELYTNHNKGIVCLQGGGKKVRQTDACHATGI